MKQRLNRRHHHERGFTLIELLIVIAVLATVTGGIFLQLDTAQQRINAEQTKVDNFDEARDFVDLFFRDINQIGYPSGRMVGFAVAPTISDTRVAVGLVKIDSNAIWFEGDIGGTGIVQSVQYMINGAGGTPGCPLCLQRSAVPKVAGDPESGQGTPGPVWGTEVNDVITSPIFAYYDTNGNAVTALPVDIDNNPSLLATIKTIHISLTIQNSAVIDLKTRQPIQTSFEGEVSINNCSMAVTGVGISCQ
jgi:prepilin-type N-terminal cleavage/methylation domain-containing protein